MMKYEIEADVFPLLAAHPPLERAFTDFLARARVSPQALIREKGFMYQAGASDRRKVWLTAPAEPNDLLVIIKLDRNIPFFWVITCEVYDPNA